MKTKTKILLGSTAAVAIAGGGYKILDNNKSNLNTDLEKPAPIEKKQEQESKIPDIYNGTAQEISGVLVNLPGENSDKTFDDLLENFDSDLSDAKKILNPDASDINDSAELAGKNVGKKFTDEDWENAGYNIVESRDDKIPNTDIESSIRKYEKDETVVVRLFDNNGESGTFIEYPDGTKVEITEFNTISVTDNEGTKTTFSPTDSGEENVFNRYLNNDSLSSLSPEELADFFEALENDENIEIRTLDTKNPEEMAEQAVDTAELERTEREIFEGAVRDGLMTQEELDRLLAEKK